jgi:hypothetical protein
MRTRSLVTALAMASFAVVLAACGTSTTSSPPGGDGPTDNGGLPGFGASPTLVTDTSHAYRVVNLHLYNSAPGAAVDVFPVNAADLAELPGTAPLAGGLAYGQASGPLHPGAVKTAADTTHYSLGVVPHSPNDPGSSNLKIDIYDSNDGKPWHQGIVVLGGTGNGLQAQTFYDSAGPTDNSNELPAVSAGAVSLLIDTRQAGDPNGPHPVSGSIVVGTPGHCLKASNDAFQGAATSITQEQDGFYVVPAGTASLGFWVGTSCAATPTFSVALPSDLAAGSRAALFVYGPDIDHLAGVVVGFGS